MPPLNQISKEEIVIDVCVELLTGRHLPLNKRIENSLKLQDFLHSEKENIKNENNK